MKYLGMKSSHMHHFPQNGTSKYNISIGKNINRQNMEKIVRITESKSRGYEYLLHYSFNV